MHKLVILFEPPEDLKAFEATWPEFIHLVEKMPGLRSESSCQVEKFLYGGTRINQVHELYFDSLQDLEIAMSSPQGKTVGKLVQQMSKGNVTLFIADHKQDDLDNIRKFGQGNDETD